MSRVSASRILKSLETIVALENRRLQRLWTERMPGMKVLFGAWAKIAEERPAPRLTRLRLVLPVFEKLPMLPFVWRKTSNDRLLHAGRPFGPRRWLKRYVLWNVVFELTDTGNDLHSCFFLLVPEATEVRSERDGITNNKRRDS